MPVVIHMVRGLDSAQRIEHLLLDEGFGCVCAQSTKRSPTPKTTLKSRCLKAN